MPHFDEFGGDEWLCQAPNHVGNRVQNSRVKSDWRPDITGSKSAGNVCPPCVKQRKSQIVGSLVRGAFLCDACTVKSNAHIDEITPVYRINIEPYKQSCQLCKQVVVELRTPAWPELFNNPIGRPIHNESKTSGFCYGGEFSGCNGLLHPSDPPRYQDGGLIHVCDTCSRQFVMRVREMAEKSKE